MPRPLLALMLVLAFSAGCDRPQASPAAPAAAAQPAGLAVDLTVGSLNRPVELEASALRIAAAIGDDLDAVKLHDVLLQAIEEARARWDEADGGPLPREQVAIGGCLTLRTLEARIWSENDLVRLEYRRNVAL